MRFQNTLRIANSAPNSCVCLNTFAARNTRRKTQDARHTTHDTRDKNRRAARDDDEGIFFHSP